MNLNVIKAGLKLKSARTLLLAKQHSPEILVGVGILGLIAGSILSYKAVKKTQGIIEEARYEVNGCKVTSVSMPESYTKNDLNKEIAAVYFRTTVDTVRVCVPAFMLTAGSVACIIGGHNILRQRNFALMAAYKLLDTGFKEYRARVVSDLGDDKDRQYRYGTKIEMIEEQTVNPETGKLNKKSKREVEVYNKDVSIYARYFDATSKEWSPVPEYNLVALKHKQAYWNDRLHTRGHVFLNEVYEDLDIDHSEAGAVVGWILRKGGDNYVDFGFFSRDGSTPAARRFVNGQEPVILLDFNVDGVIFDQL